MGKFKRGPWKWSLLFVWQGYYSTTLSHHRCRSDKEIKDEPGMRSVPMVSGFSSDAQQQLSPWLLEDRFGELSVQELMSWHKYVCEWSPSGLLWWFLRQMRRSFEYWSRSQLECASLRAREQVQSEGHVEWGGLWWRGRGNWLSPLSWNCSYLMTTRLPNGPSSPWNWTGLRDSVMLPEAPQMLSIHGARVVADNDEGDEVGVVHAS